MPILPFGSIPSANEMAAAIVTLAAQQPLAAVILGFFTIHAALAAAGRVADRIERPHRHRPTRLRGA